MPGSWLSIPALLLSLATLAAIGAGYPRAGSFGSPHFEALGALALQLQFAALTLLALITSPVWKSTHPIFRDGGWPSLRTLAFSAPLITLAQIALGAAFRYHLMGVIPHVVWAFVSAIVLLLFGAFVLTQNEAGDSLRRVAVALLVFVCVQVCLGVAALLASVAEMQKAAWMPVATTSHLIAGALVFASTLLLTAFVLRCALPASSPQLAPSGPTS
jgi:heme A synthase